MAGNHQLTLLKYSCLFNLTLIGSAVWLCILYTLSRLAVCPFVVPLFSSSRLGFQPRQFLARFADVFARRVVEDQLP
jgi:hypothetical protein